MPEEITTTSRWEELKKAEQTVFVDFTASWCGPCQRIGPYFAELAEQNKGSAIFVKVDVDKMPAVASECGISAMPTFKVFKHGTEISELVGASNAKLLALVNQHKAVGSAQQQSVSPPQGPMVDLLGSTLLSKEGEVSTASALQGKYCGLYFSAHWCPPCRSFTPELAKAYATYQKAGKPFEVVFVSSDQDQAAFDEYYAEQPWKALPYTSRDVKQRLSQKYGVRGIPTLVILSPSGEVVTTSGRAEVMKDPKGSNFPWGSTAEHQAVKPAVEAQKQGAVKGKRRLSNPFANIKNMLTGKATL